MTCSKCKTDTLASVQIKGIEVDQCDTCSGIWFDERELSSVLKEDPGILKPLLDKSNSEASNQLMNQLKGRCPRDCADLMRVFSSRNHTIVIDLCPQCRGIWLDGGELKALI